jgi:cellulose synthase/poly-beta-1,6-N-acetylglucosamine synthase-like glycosyltransferase
MPRTGTVQSARHPIAPVTSPRHRISQAANDAGSVAAPARPREPRSSRTASRGDARRVVDLTVIVPAYNEAASIADTVASIRSQTVRPKAVLVVDDCSTDGTGDVAAASGATVLRPPANTGSKAGAQNHALSHVATRYALAIDADTTLAPDAIERILSALEDPSVAAACGFVLPRRVESVWERGRYVEYLFAFTLYKPIQDEYGVPMISSGCFSAYRADVLRARGGWSNRTMAEDMDLTWGLHEAGLGVRFVPEAVCYPLEPHDFHFLSKQLRRWSHGFVQNVRLHGRSVLEVPWLRMIVAVALWDAVFAALAYLVLIPLLALFLDPLFLLAYFVDWPAVAVPVLYAAAKRREVPRALASLPCFFVLRFVNSVFLLRALWAELVRGRSLTVYEKGH